MKIFALSFFIAFILFGCGKIEDIVTTIDKVKILTDEVDKLKAREQKAKDDAEKKAKQLNEAQKQADQHTKDVATKVDKIQREKDAVQRENDAVISRLKLILWVIGFFSIAIILFSPLKNLFIRGIFRIFPYKPRRFNKGDE